MCVFERFPPSRATRLVVTALALALMAAAGPVKAASTVLVDGVRALVHDSVITVWDVEMLTAQAEPLLWSKYKTQPAVFEAKVAEVRSNNLAQLMDQQLILHEFQGMNIPANALDGEVDRELQNIIHSTYYGDRMRLIKTLQAEGTSLEALRLKIRD